METKWKIVIGAAIAVVVIAAIIVIAVMVNKDDGSGTTSPGTSAKDTFKRLFKN